MARGGNRGAKKPQSLVALAAALDTRKREVSTQGGISRSALRDPKPVAVPVPVPAKVAAPPPKLAPPPKVATPAAVTTNRAPVSTSRVAALSSLSKAPSPVPGKVPTTAKANSAPQGDIRRAYPRADIHVKAKLSLADDPSRSFEAALPTVNLSVGGMFLESSFFLKLGTRLLIQLDLPQKGRSVKVKGEVVRVESGSKGASGFALRFTEYLDGSQVTLATHFLSPVLREFLSQYAKEHRFDASAEYLAHTADVLAAWELKKAELGGDVWDLFSARA
ncbi:MAG: PilZ domain-containing protein [Archangium sp.]